MISPILVDLELIYQIPSSCRRHRLSHGEFLPYGFYVVIAQVILHNTNYYYCTGASCVWKYISSNGYNKLNKHTSTNSMFQLEILSRQKGSPIRPIDGTYDDAVQCLRGSDPYRCISQMVERVDFPVDIY
ncbi:hypothetical protein AFLA_010439 [Aspergillus flavus NRRL3357]|nr:hypothetical protein AFLA_010439 [Aspergillus flavus NRRL3357]